MAYILHGHQVYLLKQLTNETKETKICKPRTRDALQVFINETIMKEFVSGQFNRISKEIRISFVRLR